MLLVFLIDIIISLVEIYGYVIAPRQLRISTATPTHAHKHRNLYMKQIQCINATVFYTPFLYLEQIKRCLCWLLSHNFHFYFFSYFFFLLSIRFESIKLSTGRQWIIRTYWKYCLNSFHIGREEKNIEKNKFDGKYSATSLPLSR